MTNATLLVSKNLTTSRFTSEKVSKLTADYHSVQRGHLLDSTCFAQTLALHVLLHSCRDLHHVLLSLHARQDASSQEVIE